MSFKITKRGGVISLLHHSRSFLGRCNNAYFSASNVLTIILDQGVSSINICLIVQTVCIKLMHGEETLLSKGIAKILGEQGVHLADKISQARREHRLTIPLDQAFPDYDAIILFNEKDGITDEKIFFRS